MADSVAMNTGGAAQWAQSDQGFIVIGSLCLLVCCCIMGCCCGWCRQKVQGDGGTSPQPRYFKAQQYMTRTFRRGAPPSSSGGVSAQQAARDRRRTQLVAKKEVLLPCEFCPGKFPGKSLQAHQSACPQRPRARPKSQVVAQAKAPAKAARAKSQVIQASTGVAPVKKSVSRTPAVTSPPAYNPELLAPPSAPEATQPIRLKRSSSRKAVRAPSDRRQIKSTML
mmetsp:Transcript_9305/g.15854  ORF Transcript_9305/g.15854 Transcript_9305/m.15854 type:complete len:224 (-) Transcript_9305:91-762(-)